MSDTKLVFIPSMSLNYEDNLLESVGVGGEMFYRKQRDWQAIARSHEQTIERMGEENAKLRELVKAAWKCIHSGLSCSDCRTIAGGCTLKTAMRELGVEVNR